MLPPLPPVMVHEGPSDDEANALPDLVVIDGGKGQLSAALKGMKAAGIEPGETSICMHQIVDKSHRCTVTTRVSAKADIFVDEQALCQFVAWQSVRRRCTCLVKVSLYWRIQNKAGC